MPAFSRSHGRVGDQPSLVAEVVPVALKEEPEREVSITLGELPPCCADRAMLRKVFAHLIGNAVKFTGDVVDPG